MKYWNKQKEVRERCWTKITVSGSDHDFYDRKEWCMRHTGGKYYVRNPTVDNYMFGNIHLWYFERAQDASWFTLSWSK